MVFARQHFPELHQQLERAGNQDPRAFQQMVRRIAPPIRQLMRLWREDPSAAEHVIRAQKIEMRIRELRHRYLAARDDEKRAVIEAELRELLNEKFKLRLERLREEISRLRQRLDEQTTRLAEQDRDKQEIIDDEFRRLIGEPGRWGQGRNRRNARHPATRPAEADGTLE